jgi:hypothetical protein
MAVIIEDDDGECISLATGVIDSGSLNPSRSSPVVLVARELAAL